MSRKRGKFTESDVINDDNKKSPKKSKNPRVSNRLAEESSQRSSIVKQVPFILGAMSAVALRKNNDEAYLRLFELSSAIDMHNFEILAELERIETKHFLLAHSFEILAELKRDNVGDAKTLASNSELLI